MKKGRGWFVVVASCAVLFFAGSALAGPTKAQKAQHADKNNDGTVDAKEMHMEKNWEHNQQEANAWWKKRADANSDGVVDDNERAAWKATAKERMDLNNDGVIDAKERRLSWRHGRSKVNTDVEKKYDANADGWLEPDEVKNMLQDKQTLIKTDGKAKVDTPMEAEYDTNKDGIIDADEAKELKSDLEQ